MTHYYSYYYSYYQRRYYLYVFEDYTFTIKRCRVDLGAKYVIELPEDYEAWKEGDKLYIRGNRVAVVAEIVAEDKIRPLVKYELEAVANLWTRLKVEDFARQVAYETELSEVEEDEYKDVECIARVFKHEDEYTTLYVYDVTRYSCKFEPKSKLYFVF